jgi:flagellar basal body-associated protein FliL
MPVAIQVTIIILLCTIAIALIWVIFSLHNQQNQQNYRQSRQPDIIVNITNPAQQQVNTQPVTQRQQPELSDVELELEAERKITRIIAPEFSKRVEKNFESLGEKKVMNQNIFDVVNAIKEGEQ